jgi:hypothetical protein
MQNTELKIRETRTPPPKTQGETPPVVNVVDAVAAFVSRFVFLKDEALYLLVATWIIATYLQGDFDYLGYLFAYSPEPQSGKTTLLDVLDLLVASSSGIQISPTQAVLFRTADGHTQLLDEIDSWTNSEDLKSVLNAGFKKGANVTRLDKDPKSGLKANEFQVYGAKALAGIGLQTLARATRDRTFAMSMVRQKKSEKRERLRPRLVKVEAESLKKRISTWVREHHDAVVRLYAGAKFPYLQQFSDRTMDISEPLAAIVEASFDGQSRLHAQQRLVEAIRMSRNEQHSLTADHTLLRHLLFLTEADDPLVGSASELATQCTNLAEPPNEYGVGRVLKSYGFKSQSNRKTGEDPKYRYILSRKDLQEVVDRWANDELDKGTDASQPPSSSESEPPPASM